MMQKFVDKQTNYNLLFQLPTGGGKTVIFSELAKKFILSTGKKVLILTHRIELLGQTSNLLSEIGVPNKVINAKVKDLDDGTRMVYAVIRTINHPVIPWDDIASEFINPVDLSTNFKKMYVLTPLLSFVHQLAVFQDYGGPDNKYFCVLPRRRWGRFFGKRIIY